MMTRSTAASCLAVAMVVTRLLPATQAGRAVRITYAQDGIYETKDFDLLVVACDPPALAGVLDGMTNVEERVEAALQHYTLGATLWDVRRKKGEGGTYTSRLSFDILARKDGQVYAFRDEARARTGRDRRHTLLTTYQFVNSSVSEAEITSIASAAMDGSSPEYAWMGLEPTTTRLEMQAASNYFPHFSQEDLQAGLPWAVLDAQGTHNTLYVSSFTTFETVLAVYEYGNMLEGTPQVQAAFEAARNASTRPKVAIIGAGPSGLLFASQQLKRAGLTDVTFFEKQQRWGGKTKTVYHKSPGYPRKKKIPAELGVVYLANSYQAFAEMLQTQYGVEKPVRISYGPEDPGQRGVLDTASQTLIFYSLWILQKPDGTQMSAEELSAASTAYVAAHFSLVGWTLDTGVPIPPSQPEELPLMTFGQYVDSIGAGYLRNVFTWAHAAQGYGDIDEIPAYYGLIWMTPDVFTTQLDVAASATEKMATEAEEAESHRLLADGTSTLRHGSKVARRFKQSAAQEFERGVPPTFEQTSELAARCHKHVLEGEEEGEGEESDEENLDSTYLIQEGYQKVWDKLVHKEGFRSKIKLGVNVVKIERQGLGDY